MNASRCNALHTSGCASTPARVTVGNNPDSIAIDEATNTIYVANEYGDTVSVINGATCNAKVTSGCDKTPAAVRDGMGPAAVGVNQGTDTVYVANWGNETGNTVSVINGRTCNGRVTVGCDKAPATVKIGTGPAGLVVDQANDTVYAGTVAPKGAEAIWVIDGATCNSTTKSGCGQKPSSVRVGTGSINQNIAFAVDPATETLYATNWQSDTLSMIDTAICNAAISSGCAQTPKVARVGQGPTGIALDLATHTLYVANLTDNTVSVLDAATCNAKTNWGCSRRPSRLLRSSEPTWATMDPATDTVYVPGGSTVSVFDGAVCNAAVTSGCA